MNVIALNTTERHVGQRALSFHPLAEALPLIEGDEFDRLVDSIKANGLRDPITMLDDLILDGRNRYRACLEAGVEVRTAPFTGSDPMAFVIDKNLRRRHLNSGQKAMAVVKFATLSKGNPHRNLITGQPVITQSEIAAKAGINKSTVSDAKTICADGTKEEIESVANGTALITPVAKQVRARRDGGKDKSVAVTGKPLRGIRIAVPDGTTLSKVVRRGIELEEQGEALPVIARTIGVSLRTYVVVRDAILLLEQKDHLTENDTRDVAQALSRIDEDRQIGKAYEIIKPIATRLWGRKGSRNNRRSEQFDNAISFLLHTCESAVDVAIPYLNKARSAEAIEHLLAAEMALRKLRGRITGGSV